MNYNYIVDPITKKSYILNTKKGLDIFNRYLSYIY